MQVYVKMRKAIPVLALALITLTNVAVVQQMPITAKPSLPPGTSGPELCKKAL